ncbi:hypothetical protein JCM1393_10000 [Clostridium carnis]
MDIYSLNGDQLIVVAAVIAAEIAKGLTPEQQDILAWLFEAIGENLSVYGAVESFRSSNDSEEDAGISK